MALNNSHIEFIKNEIERHSIVADDLVDELVDHFCELIEERMAEGQRFFEAHQSVMESFGASSGITAIQHENIKTQQQQSVMFKNYLKIAIRNIKKQKFYSFINVFGLATGIAASLLIVLFIINELQYDNFHTKRDRIYRIISDVHFGDNDFTFPVAPAPLAAALRLEFPEVENTVRIRKQGSFLVRPAESAENIKVDDLGFVDSTFFKIFTVPLISGNEEDALKGPNKIVISESTARNLFGSGEAMGRQVLLDGDRQAVVSGVFKDFPSNSHMQMDILVSMESLEESFSQIWLSNNFYTYVLLGTEGSAAALETKFPAMVDKYVGPQIKQFVGVDFEAAKEAGTRIEYTLQSLPTIYLHSNYTFDIGPSSDIQKIYIFSAIAFLIMVLACINFMNLSTARSTTRAKEVGIRKVLGSIRGHLMRQFLTESVLLTAIAFVIAIFFAQIFLPSFNQIASKDLTIPFSSPLFYAVSLSGILLLGIAAGLYPSFFLSAFRPVQVLKGKILNSRSGAPIRSTLVVLQFVITIALLLGTTAVYKQLKYISDKKLGFNKEEVLIVRDAYMLGNDLEAYRNNVLSSSNISYGSVSGYLPVTSSNRSDATYWEEGKAIDDESMVNSQVWVVDDQYVNTMGMEIIDGRNFSPEFPSDSTAVILNETAVKAFALDEPIGSRLQSFAYNPRTNESYPDSFNTYTVVGVMKDFHFNDMHRAISPVMFQLGNNSSLISFRFNSANTDEVIAFAEKEWKALNSGVPFNYGFLDDEFSSMYQNEQRLGDIITIFAVLAVLIGCLGLFGLATFLTEQRTKEIGIRKVLGASNQTIVMLLSRDFGKLVLISFIVAVPFAWYMISRWLVSFEYKTSIGWEIYLYVGFVAFAIAGISIGYQAIRAALSNPAEIIRSE